MITSRTALTTLVAATTLALPGVAAAHITLQPSEAPAGAYVVENVRVPNEKEDAGTTKLVVQFPAGFESASTQPVPGWSAKVETTGSAVKTITWTAQGDTKIGPGEFQDFPISIKIPDAEQPLTFKALQTYDDGETVRWIGDEASDKPAPVVKVTAAEGDEHGGATAGHDDANEETAATEPASATSAPVATADDESSDTLAIIALIVGALGLVVGSAGVATARKSGAA